MIATAIAHPNIALVKYWGKRDPALNLPAVPSLSLTLDTFRTRTRVEWGIDAPADRVVLDGAPAPAAAASRVSRFLDLVAEPRPRCAVTSDNNFPTAAGLASSSSAFAALALAAATASGQPRSAARLSVLARRGSGSACRSVWGGWVEWRMGVAQDGSDCHGIPIAPAEHWDVRLVVATLEGGEKEVGSTEGMERTRRTSPFYPAWVEAAPADLDAARAAVLARDLDALGPVMERSAFRMHATMLGADPPVRYWKGPTLDALDAVASLRRRGLGAWATVDAGPNVKVLCLGAESDAVADALREVAADVRILGVGGDARVE